MSFNITPVASGYQEIHPYSAMNIDSVKINTSLIRMKEWEIHPRQPRNFPRPEGQRKSWGQMMREWESIPDTWPKRFPEDEAQGKSWVQRGWISQYTQRFKKQECYFCPLHFLAILNSLILALACYNSPARSLANPEVCLAQNSNLFQSKQSNFGSTQLI